MYVISVKKVNDYYGNPLSEDKQDWEYLGDDVGTSLSSGYPCWLSERSANIFKSVDEAKQYFEFARRYIITPYTLNKYDWNTLAIRKRVYKKIEDLL